MTIISNISAIDLCRKFSLICIFLLAAFSGFSQAERKSIKAIPASESIKIDGILDEEIWIEAPTAEDFIQQRPYNGSPASLPSEVRFVFDNSGLYIGAMMYDPSPDSILTQLGLRDSDNLNADFFTIMLSPFDDGLNAFAFRVYASDVQTDYKVSSESDFHLEVSWDAVWQSKARINAAGWVVEMKIPYSALRFPETEIQTWGMNCQRDIRRYRELSSWNFIDAKVRGIVNQTGILRGIQGIKPPLRLSLTPYVSGYVEKNPDYKEWQFSYNYGADLKYGINQSFTLDMTLIPDFGQVQSDDKIYNFSPFEIHYSEKRQFFTEGTELFDKGGIFYSRRVGSQPDDYDEVYDQLDSNEVVKENPMQTRLINATKVSGRTNKGLGIGVFNGMSANTWATIEDTITGDKRRVLTQGFTNYNMLVFDQALKNNSYFSVLNTNLYRADIGYSANVSGIDFKFANRPYTHAVFGNAFVSQKYYAHQAPEFGYAVELEAGKISGNFQYGYRIEIQNDTYDPNDMGFNQQNNRFENEITLEYNIYEPFWKVLDWSNEITVEYNAQYNGLHYTSFIIEGSTRTTTRKYLTLGAFFEIKPDGYDYYEPRVDGWKYSNPGYVAVGGFTSSDYRKKLALDTRVTLAYSSRYITSYYELELKPRFRPNDRLLFIYRFYMDHVNNDPGYVLDSINATGEQVIIFGRRDIQTMTNVLEANYMIRSNMSLNLRLRHYWVWAHYLSFYNLRPDGYLNPSDYSGNHDVDYNQFNIDLSFIWDFAPGSQLSFVWKNAINTYDDMIDYHFFRNLGNTLTSPATNSFSIRVLYYIDAMYFKKKKKLP
ncbi:MAG: carbohydrate binding family 9 domain-containing protein [Bacteroidetes bacterium]|nr:carbohydrate binding family 9 domain-containing protein [Bacteroidota bacterium]